MTGVRFVVDPYAPPGKVYFLDPRTMYVEGTFDAMIHSTPARTKGHALEIAIHEEIWGMVADARTDYGRQWFR